MVKATGTNNSVGVFKNVSFDFNNFELVQGQGIITAGGDLLIGTGDTDPNPEIKKGVLTSPSGSIDITYNSPNLELEAVYPNIFIWENISASQTLEVQHGYFCSSGGTLNLQLPATSEVGDTIEVALIGASGWKILQSAGQFIRVGNTGTTVGVTGFLASNQQGDAIRLVCQTANLTWMLVGPVGNWTIN